MQSLFSVFRRSSAEQQPPSQGPPSSSAANTTTMTTSTPRHLDEKPEPSGSATQVNMKKSLPPPPPPKRQQNAMEKIPPPPLPSDHSAVPSYPCCMMPIPLLAIYLAVYSQPDSPSGYRLALQFASPSIAREVSEYSCANDFATSLVATPKLDEIYLPKAGLPYRVDVTKLDCTADDTLIGRVMLGSAPYSHGMREVDACLHSIRLRPSASVDVEDGTRSWIEPALFLLRQDGLLIEEPTTTTSPLAVPLTTLTVPTSPHPSSTTTTKPPLPPHTSVSQPRPPLPPNPTEPNKPPSQPASLNKRPDLSSRDTDNWNDIPENFLSVDSAAGGSHRRKPRGTTPRVTPRSSLGNMRNVSSGAPPPTKEQQGRDWANILRVAEEWALAVRDEPKLDGRKLRMLNLSTGEEKVEQIL
jgi:hypothetical protein